MELRPKTKKLSDKISENVHIVANDPSLAFFRIQEHVRKVIPTLLEKRSEVAALQNNLQGHCYDMEYAVCAVKDIEMSDKSFKNILESIKTSIFLKQQLKFEEMRNKNQKDNARKESSIYKRFSAHLTLDLPEFPDLGGVMRETSHRVENIIATNRSSLSTQNSIAELQRSHTTLH